MYDPTPSNTDDVIDSRDVIQRIENLRADWTEATGGDDPDDYALTEDDWAVGLGAEGAAEMVALLALAREGEDYLADWQHGETLVRGSYFTTYAEELADDLGLIDSEHVWPNSYIDWELAARDLRMDYTSLDFDGVTYWGRS